ncbi:hypothetical protein BpHYR1_048004 [Brachionus plicatilis]|uniref:Uncharacterized protein n=1 Tax=Brachionus plicatilis TaxID=10195 RepID=A0A3M7T9K4_BRAPC|nr:hypothetical protein BpHYR1_048004 [Brachionus plicatilis]
MKFSSTVSLYLVYMNLYNSNYCLNELQDSKFLPGSQKNNSMFSPYLFRPTFSASLDHNGYGLLSYFQNMNFDNDSTSLNSLSLNSFRKFEASCRALQTVRLVSEKKSLLSEIGEFLNDSKILRILDSLTCGELEIEYDKENVPQYSQYSNEPLSLDWNTLFNLIQNFVINELKTIKDKNISFSQSNRTASSQNIDNKIYQLRAVLNLVLNQINSRTRHYLKLSNFLNLFDSLSNLLLPNK